MAADRRSRASRTPAAVTGHGQDVEFGDLELPLSLGQQWEESRVIRARLRENEFRMVKWVKPELVNKPSMASIALNAHALTILAHWWCPQQKTPKSPSVLDLKKEAGVTFVNVARNDRDSQAP